MKGGGWRARVDRIDRLNAPSEIDQALMEALKQEGVQAVIAQPIVMGRLVLAAATDLGFVEALQDDFQRRRDQQSRHGDQPILVPRQRHVKHALSRTPDRRCAELG
jgi:hypothetical protein